MSSASFLILYAKRHLCHFWLILWMTISAVPGLILGLEVATSSRITALGFTTAVSCFAIAFFYHRECTRQAQEESQADQAVEAWDLLRFDLESSIGRRIPFTNLPWLLTALACIFGMAGAFSQPRWAREQTCWHTSLVFCGIHWCQKKHRCPKTCSQLPRWSSWLFVASWAHVFAC